MQARVALSIRPGAVLLEYGTGGAGRMPLRYIVEGGSRGIPPGVESVECEFTASLPGEEAEGMDGSPVSIRLSAGRGHVVPGASITVVIGEGPRARRLQARTTVVVGGAHASSGPRVLTISGRLRRYRGILPKGGSGEAFMPPYVPVFPSSGGG